MNFSTFLLFILFIFSCGLTWLIKRFYEKRKILDIPNERSSHSKAVPRGGGLAIVLTWYAGITAFYLLNLIDKNLYFAFLCGILLASVSFLDDIRSLSPLIRLVAQSLSVALALLFLGGIQQFWLFENIQIPLILLYPSVVLGMIWFINLYNFLDGIDGYASIEAITMAVAFYLFTGQSLTFILMASVLGFLIWNWPKAKIFMGDVGSTQLGFIIVILGIYFHNQNQLSIINWLILTAPFWFDATLTLFRRVRNKEKLSQAHKKHIYQRLVQSGFSHLKVDILLTIFNLIIISLVYMCQIYKILIIPTFFFVISTLYMLAIYTDKRKAF